MRSRRTSLSHGVKSEEDDIRGKEIKQMCSADCKPTFCKVVQSSTAGRRIGLNTGASGAKYFYLLKFKTANSLWYFLAALS